MGIRFVLFASQVKVKNLKSKDPKQRRSRHHNPQNQRLLSVPSAGRTCCSKMFQVEAPQKFLCVWAVVRARQSKIFCHTTPFKVLQKEFSRIKFSRITRKNEIILRPEKNLLLLELRRLP